MSATPRQKACHACADSKRRCDKQLPECQRCLDRDLDCVYPQPKRRRRDSIARHNHHGGLSVAQNSTGTDALGSRLNLGLGHWGAMGGANLEVSFSDVMIPYEPMLPAPIASPRDGGSPPSTPCPWFLEDGTWDMQHSTEDPACVTAGELEPLIDKIGDMLQSWVQTGHNSFIHPRLYATGMPACLQDAFTTLAAYHARTPAVKDTVLQIADDRSRSLVRQGPSAGDGGAPGILERLARVQALFVYDFIRLFDGSVRMRASAERQLPTLRRWLEGLRQAARRYRAEDGFLGQSPLEDPGPAVDREYDAASKMWQLWALMESARRTHVVADLVANIYQIMTQGWAECAGAVMFTARRGLWGAGSAAEWFERCCASPPLMAPFLKPGPFISQHAAEEADDFATSTWKFVVGSDKIQSWIDRGKHSQQDMAFRKAP